MMHTDNSDLQSKISIRQKGLTLIPGPYRVLEFYAGAGVLTNVLWAKVAEKVVSIEKQSGKFNTTFTNVISIEDNCYNHIPKCLNFNVIDCDAYGLVLPIFLKCIDVAQKGSILFLRSSIQLSSDMIG